MQDSKRPARLGKPQPVWVRKAPLCTLKLIHPTLETHLTLGQPTHVLKSPKKQLKPGHFLREEKGGNAIWQSRGREITQSLRVRETKGQEGMQTSRVLGSKRGGGKRRNHRSRLCMKVKETGHLSGSVS